MTERQTETEWEHQRAQKECATYGHDWEVIETMAVPLYLVCNRPCGAPTYHILPEEQP